MSSFTFKVVIECCRTGRVKLTKRLLEPCSPHDPPGTWLGSPGPGSARDHGPRWASGFPLTGLKSPASVKGRGIPADSGAADIFQSRLFKSFGSS